MAYTVYVKTDAQKRIVSVNSSAFLPDTSGWMEIDSGFGDRFYHAQGNYFPLPIMDERDIYRYKLVDGQTEERTQEEMDADYTPHADSPTIEARVQTVEGKTAELAESLDMLISGVTSDV